MNALFLDFAEEHQKVGDLYPSEKSIPSSDLPHRGELCRILEQQNANFGNDHAPALLKKLARPETRCVITGQQTGLLTGPMYTIWKAFSALKYAAEMNRAGIPCVPVFWMASEDHNWHEILNLNLLRPSFDLQSYSLKDHLFLKRQPTGSVPVNHPEVKRILLRVFHDFQLPEMKEIYSHGTLAEGFARTLLWLLRDFPILLVDPADPELKQIAAPFFSRFFERSKQMMKLLEQQNEDLRSRNYPMQVKMEEGALPLFRIEGDTRIHVKEETHDGLHPGELSPSALLRPLFQDFIFPTLAYIGGPAEIAYFAQLHPWYAAMNMEQPRLLARASVTLLPAITRSFLDSKNVKPEDLFVKEENLLDALIHDQKVESLRKQIKDLHTAVRNDLANTKAAAAGTEPTLAKAFDTSGRKIEYQLQKMERKTLLAIRKKNDLLAQQIRKAKNVIYPDEKLQERALNIFSFSSRLPDLIQETYSKVDIHAKGHQWIAI